jgi:hypothetical protein
VFLFSQPRSIARVVTPASTRGQPEALHQLISREPREHFTDLTTDLEAFNTGTIVVEIEEPHHVQTTLESETVAELKQPQDTRRSGRSSSATR